MSTEKDKSARLARAFLFARRANCRPRRTPVFVFLTDINIGVAISLRQGGLVAPALRNADRQSLHELMKNFRDLVKRARAGSEQ